MRRLPAPTFTNLTLAGTALMATATLGSWVSIPACIYFTYKYINQPSLDAETAVRAQPGANSYEEKERRVRNGERAYEPSVAARPVPGEQSKAIESSNHKAFDVVKIALPHGDSDSTPGGEKYATSAEQDQHTFTEFEALQIGEILHNFFDQALDAQIDAFKCDDPLEAKKRFESVIPLLYSVPGAGPDNGRRRSLATFNTGLIYEMGAPGVSIDLNKALEWYKKAVLMNAYGGYRAAFHICNIYQEMLGFESREVHLWHGKTFRMFNEPHCKPTELDNQRYRALIFLYRPCKFKSRALLKKHFRVHKQEFGGSFNNSEQYQDGARKLIAQGLEIVHLYKNKIQTAFCKRTKEGNKYEYVDLDAQGFISTYHIKEKEIMTEIVVAARRSADHDVPQSPQSYIHYSCQP